MKTSKKRMLERFRRYESVSAILDSAVTYWPMKLAVFDVDGTLVSPHPGDDRCYLDAIRLHQAFSEIPANWEQYKYSTDSGVLHEIFLRHVNRPPSDQESAAIRETYTQLLAATLKRDDPPIQQIPGACETLAHLMRRRTEWVLGIATGSWRESTILKLQFTGFACEGLPSAFAEDHLDRSGILRTAIQRAERQYGVVSFDGVAYVGDRPWDQKAARELHVGFVGISSPMQASSFADDVKILPDLTHFGDFIDALQGAVRDKSR